MRCGPCDSRDQKNGQHRLAISFTLIERLTLRHDRLLLLGEFLDGLFSELLIQPAHPRAILPARDPAQGIGCGNHKAIELPYVSVQGLFLSGFTYCLWDSACFTHCDP